ncbi:hypothetical protein ILUMI_21901 [Ignelater luminosus]|uniref:Uncharacterized protein n=1 Tax=Ignelater luminosus TaxID=2038154 RepID=A0A8K0FXN3_IGNLU|nr:hypothetical protein ILUMI_21901 [Ignelater luminosus]
MKTEHVTAETLTGGFPPLIPVMSDQVLESMVTHLVRCTCDNVTDCPKSNEKGATEEKDFPIKQRELDDCNEEDEGKTPMKWDSILKDFLSRCPRLCTDEPLKQTIPLGAARWRETNDRQVLAPLDLTDNIIAGNLDMSRKRKAEVPNSIWIPNKRIKVEDTVKLKLCSVVVKRAPLNILSFQYKNANIKSYVKLYDFFKEVPQTKQDEKEVSKNEYMGFLNLDSKEPCDPNQLSLVKTSHPTKLSNFPQIPFSSDYGRLLLARERHCLPQEVALRKIDRMEWYLKGTAPVLRNNNNNNNYYYNNNNNIFINNPDFIIYDRKVRNLHLYKFPKRQFHQKHQTLYQSLIKYVCKPVCVHLEKLDITPYLAKPKDVIANGNVTTTAPTDTDDVEIINIEIKEIPSIENNEQECVDDSK